MRRWGAMVLAVLVMAFLSGKRTSGNDVAQLRPAEVVAVIRVDGKIQIQLDTEDSGVGENLEAALDDLNRTAPAKIFMETAEYLLVSKECEDVVLELMDYLRPSCALCLLEGEPDMEKLPQYLRIHTPEVTLREYRVGFRDLETLKIEQGRMEIVS